MTYKGKQFNLGSVERESSRHFKEYHIDNYSAMHTGQVVVYGNVRLAKIIVDLLNTYVDSQSDTFEASLEED